MEIKLGRIFQRKPSRRCCGSACHAEPSTWTLGRECACSPAILGARGVEILRSRDSHGKGTDLLRAQGRRLAAKNEKVSPISLLHLPPDRGMANRLMLRIIPRCRG